MLCICNMLLCFEALNGKLITRHVFLFIFNNYFFFISSRADIAKVVRISFLYRYKIRFKGKGYRLFSLRRNSVIFNFGYSHLLLKYFFNTQLIVQPKLYVIVLGLNFFVQRQVAFEFFYVRYINIFNLRGMRLIGERYRKKAGEISQYR